MKEILAITAGDPAGIGYEIVLDALTDTAFVAKLFGEVRIVVFGNVTLLERLVAERDISLRIIGSLGSGDSLAGLSERAIEGCINVFDIPMITDNFIPGKIHAHCGQCAYDAIIAACELAKMTPIRAIVTAPVDKRSLRLAGVESIGHTEILARAFGVTDPLTLFVTRELRIFFYSRHLSLRDAIDALSVERLADFIAMCDIQLRNYGFTQRRLALAALNPHASDGGQFGTEEAEILTPAVAIARQKGVTISDPIGADSVFAQAADGRYDAVISLYHDQGHIAAKTYDFHRTISATLGLPTLRTSVDHGTAMDIAWQGKANALSMQTAIDKALSRLQ